MGGVLMQYPPYFTADDREHEHRTSRAIERAAEMLKPLPVFVEFRHSSWVEGKQLARTMRFLADRFLTYVAVDAPQIAGRARDAAGHRRDLAAGLRALPRPQRGHVERAHRSAADRFDYLYAPEELEEWREPIQHLAEETERTWVMFNNCKYDYAPRNAREMAEILGDVVAPRLSSASGRSGERRRGAAEAPGAGDDSRRFSGTLF